MNLWVSKRRGIRGENMGMTREYKAKYRAGNKILIIHF